MEKELFIKTLQNYPHSTVEEADELRSLKERFPYSQILHVLSARASKEHSLSYQQHELQLAAVYSADRNILKNIITSNRGIYESELNGVAVTTVEEIIIPPSIAIIDENQEQPDLAEMVLRDLKELSLSRHNFEVMFADGYLSPAQEKDSGKSKKERIIELTKALSVNVSEGDEKPTKKKRENNRKDIIDELVDTKTKIEPESEKQKEQIEIIDHFIKAQPSISNSKDKIVNIQEGDLDTIKTGEFNDNIVSETLVELLLKQGKKDKAIEVLKKLIWKFPQKKAYFAAQIEQLKN